MSTHVLEERLRIQTIKRHLQEKQETNDCPVRGSGLGGCPRELALRLAGTPRQELTPETLAMFERGHQRGADLAELLREGLLEVGVSSALEHEVWFELPDLEEGEAEQIFQRLEQIYGPLDLPVRVADGKLLVRGRIDLLAGMGQATENGPPAITNPRELWVVDFKATGAYPFARLDLEGPRGSNILQITLYRRGLEPDAVVRGFLIYEAQDGDARKGFVPCEKRLFEVDLEEHQAEAERALGETRDVLRAMLADRLEEVEPHPEFEPKGRKLPWQCDYCSIGPQTCAAWGEVINKGTVRKQQWSMV